MDDGTPDEKRSESDAVATSSLETVERQSRMLELSHQYLSLAASIIPEVELLLSRLKESKGKQATMTGLPSFVGSLERDREVLGKLAHELSQSGLDDAQLKARHRKLEPSLHAIGRADTQWQVLKRCRSFVAVNQAFQGSSREGRRREIALMDVAAQEKQKMHRLMKEQGRVEVDVVDSGREWVVIKALQPDRLARHMTDAGWGWGEHAVGERVDEEEWEDVPLAKFVRRLVVAAGMNRCEYRVPRIRLVLPNMAAGNAEFDSLLYQLAHMDPRVEVIIEDMRGTFMATPPPPPDVAIENLIPDELEGLTQTVNLDHTILIDLISDLTHVKLQPQPWQARTTRMQIEEENQHEGGLMAKTLYPVLQGRTLVCTYEAAEHFHQVLETVGTRTEKERGRLLVPSSSTASAPLPAPPTPTALREAFQELSMHALPVDVALPVQVLDERWTMDTVAAAVDAGTLPPGALGVARRSGFKSSKLSIFMYGWAAGVATVTSNREVAGQVRTWVGDGVGPLIWRVGVTRNLLAKAAVPREDCTVVDGSEGEGEGGFEGAA